MEGCTKDHGAISADERLPLRVRIHDLEPADSRPLGSLSSKRFERGVEMGESSTYKTDVVENPQAPTHFRAAIVMGAAGSGKTTFGRVLARSLSVDFLDADEFHTASAKEKMSRGQPLDDQDRAPWLAQLRAILDERKQSAKNPVILACSALKERYRDQLGVDDVDVRLVYLSVPKTELRRRLQVRMGHYAGPELLDSQLATLEVPESGLHLDGTRPVSWLVARARDFLCELPRVHQA